MKVFCFPRQDISVKIKDLLLEADKFDQNVFLGMVDEVWIIDLENQAMYIANSENPQLLKLKPLEVE